MDRRLWVTFQPKALRSVVKQAHGVAASAAEEKPLPNLGEENCYPLQRSVRKDKRCRTSLLWIQSSVGWARRIRRARRLLTEGKAAVSRRYPFTIILKRAVPAAQPDLLRLKIDPGSKPTGLAIVHDRSGAVVWAAELSHRGQQIRDRLLARRAIRRSRRQRHTRCRPARFANRRRPTGWLPPSLASRVQNVLPG